jgi:hypothetical protein
MRFAKLFLMLGAADSERTSAKKLRLTIGMRDMLARESTRLVRLKQP